jgi:hypothetical protein
MPANVEIPMRTFDGGLCQSFDGFAAGRFMIIASASSGQTV